MLLFWFDYPCQCRGFMMSCAKETTQYRNKSRRKVLRVNVLVIGTQVTGFVSTQALASRGACLSDPGGTGLKTRSCDIFGRACTLFPLAVAKTATHVRRSEVRVCVNLVHYMAGGATELSPAHHMLSHHARLWPRERAVRSL